MIPDFKCRSRQKTNKRKLVNPIIPAARTHKPKGKAAGVKGNHLTQVGRWIIDWDAEKKSIHY